MSRFNSTYNKELNDQIGLLSGDFKKNNLKPYFIEYFASFNKYGLGTPSGITNYTNGNYVLTVSGNAGDTFVTVISGNIADAGATTKWPCVIKNDDGLFDRNKVLGTDSINKVNLLKPLKRNITSGLLGNLHDAALGQHYTELGYFAFSQHLYFSVPRYAERNNVLAQFLEDDTSGKWVVNGYVDWGLAVSMRTSDDTYRAIGGKALALSAADATKYVEWQEIINSYKGYVETIVGCSVGSAKVEFYLDDVLVDSKTVDREVERIIFPFEYAKTGKIKIMGLGTYPQSVYIGRTTWFVNEKYSKDKLIQPSLKVAYIGDSWGEYHNKATTRELKRLMQADGGTPTVLDFSKGGHTSTYAKVWFDEYIIKNKPDIVIIEYFTNDFNSINGTNVGTFLNPNGVQQDMNISSLIQYENNMRYMIDKAIENGIQPIVIMPASTNAESQVLSFANKGNDMWNGLKITNDTPFFQTATVGKTVTNNVEANGTNDVTIKSKATNSSSRKGVKIDSDINLTGGDIGGFYNNGVRKMGVKHDGTLEAPYLLPIPQTYDLPANTGNRGRIYLQDQAGLDDSLKIVIEKSDGTFAIKKIQLID
ncbi:SGNH/GDSL hydrolase family protein [Priestia megaterium]|uniref:SGNH/GDSL hydrolase family protein n=1 Tax=Priestia megaterium TaxID=1404 RepID=UPI00300006EF